MGKLFVNDDSLDYNDDGGWFYAPTPTKDENRPSEEEIDRQVDELLKELAVKKVIVRDRDNYAHNSARMCEYECYGLFIDDSATSEQVQAAFEKEGDWRNPNEGFHLDRFNEVKVENGKLKWTISVKPGYRRLKGYTQMDNRGWFRYSGTIEVNVSEVFSEIAEAWELKYTPTALTQRRFWDSLMEYLASRIIKQYSEMDPLEPYDTFKTEMRTLIYKLMSGYGDVYCSRYRNTIEEVVIGITDFANKIAKPLGFPYSSIYRMVSKDSEIVKRRYRL